jgi:hypothetical protein
MVIVTFEMFTDNVDLYEQMSQDTTSLLYQFQQAFKKVMGFTLPVFHARGIFNYDTGLMPYRRPVHILVGSPIKVTLNDQPTSEEIEDIHKQYVEGLQYLWDKYKDAYGSHIKHMQIVE